MLHFHVANWNFDEYNIEARQDKSKVFPLAFLPMLLHLNQSLVNIQICTLSPKCIGSHGSFINNCNLYKRRCAKDKCSNLEFNLSYKNLFYSSVM